MTDESVVDGYTVQQQQELYEAAVDMIERTGAAEYRHDSLTFDDKIVWIATVAYPDGRWDSAASPAPYRSALRLAEQLVDGGTCVHCKRPTGLEERFDEPPAGPFNLVCWFQYDPELKKFRRGCEGR